MNRFLVTICTIFGLITFGQAQIRLDTNVFIFSKVLPVNRTQVLTVQQNWSQTGTPLHLYFQSISATNGTKSEKLISLKTGPFKALVKDVFLWNGQLNLLSSVYYTGPGRSNFLLQQLDAITLKEKNQQLIDAVATPRPNANTSYVGYCISRDSNLIGFYSWIYAYAEDSVRLNIQVYDRSLEKKWSKQYTLPFVNRQFLIKDCALRNNGSFFLFGENYTGRIGAGTTIRENRIEHLALQMRQDLDTAQIIRPVLEKGTFISSIQFGLSKDETLYGMGISESQGFSSQSGLFVLKLPEGTDQYTQRIEEIPKVMYQNAEKEARQDAVLGETFSSTGFFNYRVFKLYLEPEGQVYLLANYQDMCMLMRFDEDLQMQYISLIPRLRYGFFEKSYDGNIFIKGDQVYFLQTQVENAVDPAYALVRIGSKGELIHCTIESSILARRPKFMLSASYCALVDKDYVVLTGTDNQVPYNSPRTLTFRVEEIAEVVMEKGSNR